MATEWKASSTSERLLEGLDRGTGEIKWTATRTVDVQHVIGAYHEAVLTHDGSRLASLFLPQSLWLNVLSDEAYARAKAKSPDAVKIRVGSYADFAKVVSTSKASFNPTHTHLRENSDGTGR
jgi:hypothetical protein